MQKELRHGEAVQKAPTEGGNDEVEGGAVEDGGGVVGTGEGEEAGTAAAASAKASGEGGACSADLEEEAWTEVGPVEASPA